MLSGVCIVDIEIVLRGLSPIASGKEIVGWQSLIAGQLVGMALSGVEASDGKTRKATMYDNVIDALDDLFTEIGELSRLLGSGRFGRALGPTPHVASLKGRHASLNY